MKLIKHKQDSHRSKPFIFNIWLSIFEFEKEFSFTDSCKYDLGNIDNYDWNKLTGISFNLIDARVNSVMTGWRYDIKDDNFELCLYSHVNCSFNPPAESFCSVKSNEKFKVRFLFRKDEKKVYMEVSFPESDKNKVIKEVDFEKFGICREINTWFGGTSKAPHNMEIIKY